ncbi:hypothetical protein HPB51_007901 [Rhipicephalus microplus]|uniref:Uncharacterized protein n=1 Tax=Rhipicephalus microplus TaxID=6941 RepID=A0A9J6EMI7_RHIMP|nr:hypothetical protein HPB51_007901 [Rhipicephalus microplus]
MISLANKYLTRINYRVIRHASLPANASISLGERLRSERRRFCTGNSFQCEVRYEWKNPKSDDEVVNITYVKKDGSKVAVRGKVGDNLLYLAHRYGIEMEGCQIILTKDLEGMEVTLPQATRNFYVDGHVPQPH